MNRKVICILAVVLAVIVSSWAEGASQIRLAVLNTTKSAELRQLSETLANTFTGTLAKSKAVALAEREELDVILREQKISASELEESAARIGGLIGCNYVVVCSLVYSDSPVVSARLVDAATSEVVYSDSEIPDAMDNTSLTAASSRMADKLLEVLTGEQAVITELGDYGITINRGSSSGVRVGDMYRVYKGTKRTKVNLAVIRVKDVQLGFSHAEIVNNGGYISTLRRADKIEAVSKKEAETLVRRKSFAKKRPGEKAGQELVVTSLTKLFEPLMALSEDFGVLVQASIDKVIKQIPPGFQLTRDDVLSRNYDPKMLCRLGEDIDNLCSAVTKAKDPLLEQFKSMFSFVDEIDFASKKWSQEQTLQWVGQMFDMIGRIGHAFSAICFGAAAETGYPEAQNKLGVMYYLGYGYAYELFMNDKVDVMFDVDWDNVENINFTKIAPARPDYVKAGELFTKAATQGNTDAQANLGTMYRYGEGVKQDYKKALELLSKAAANGGIGAIRDLGYMYYNGQGVKQDHKKAAEFFSKAASMNDSTAQNNAGYMYLNGIGVKKDYKKALAFLNMAASQNNSEAYNTMANMYLNGLGVPKDIRKAIQLLRSAASLGHEGAKNTLQALGAN